MGRAWTVMGVVNVTPDSFSDGGLWLDAGAAIDHGVALREQGAEILDIGGESTRPGAEPVSEAEELRRVVPVLEGLASGRSARRSASTRRSSPSRARRSARARPTSTTSPRSGTTPRSPGSWPRRAATAA